ncbi:phosphomannomutase/phosphoglucomutase [Frankia sp. AgKG'84/4]|uniref:phosphomannomutase/phosphoglucomutase n=1 Tax=Frankia sp. AgKG'84/4 TaxID=573490 RepID=UPI0020103C0C|nr:phosphomannomutase/phosphoglucomutase [Frankia sp. AgKG'84/4]MCL9795592.1 phosphomannomutase/phosphoglucomutase [Frankia sp. AgKG'84/4]
MRDLSRIFKAYDVRGVVPSEFDADIARRTGAAFVRLTGADRIVTAHDMRESSVPLAAAFAQGATEQGADVILAGLGSTDLLYFAAGSLDIPGAMFTASHNPAKYNGIKLCRAGAAPIGQETGLAEIREMVERGVPAGPGRRGSITERDLLADYVRHLHTLVDLSGIRPLTVAVDAGNGMGGLTVPATFDGLPLKVIPLFFELDGSFPNHEANPIEPANLRDLQAAVRASGADLGLAFDGDADRCFVVDERGEIVSPSVITALVADRELAREPGGTIIHNVIVSQGVPELVLERGGVPVRTRVGHSFIKAEMARTGAIFGGEHSGHFYFRDFWRADSGMLAALHVLAALGGQDRPLSQLLDGYARYSASGEINSEVADATAEMLAIEKRYAPNATAVDHLDGLTVTFADGSWFNLRPSNTEPLLRLNVEGPDDATMSRLRDEILAQVRSGKEA